jgi:hypothetical protein
MRLTMIIFTIILVAAVKALGIKGTLYDEDITDLS